MRRQRIVRSSAASSCELLQNHADNTRVCFDLFRDGMAVILCVSCKHSHTDALYPSSKSAVLPETLSICVTLVGTHVDHQLLRR